MSLSEEQLTEMVAALIAKKVPGAVAQPGMGGFFSKIGKAFKKLAKGVGKVLKKALPIAAIVVNVIPGIGQVASAAIKAADFALSVSDVVHKRKVAKEQAQRALAAAKTAQQKAAAQAQLNAATQAEADAIAAQQLAQAKAAANPNALINPMQLATSYVQSQAAGAGLNMVSADAQAAIQGAIRAEARPAWVLPAAVVGGIVVASLLTRKGRHASR